MVRAKKDHDRHATAGGHKEKPMTIDFGKVERYIEDRGFGFVSHTFAKIPPREVFFHIKAVKRTHPEMPQALDGTKTIEKLYFWYEYRTSSKGQEVLGILDLKQIQQKYADDIVSFIDTIKTSWMNVGKPLPESLRKATSDLLNHDEVNQLMASRETLEAEQRRHQEELQRAESARLQAIAEQRAAQERAEAVKRQAIAEQRVAQQRVEEEEFRQLVAEMSAQRFTKSSQVSKYIVRHKLGHKYK
ncbi:MAG TPA: hypothetical protein DEF27_03400, partial [Oscillatoriales bacterium UBA8482]|nr:hypothetical protein [Oscillatoriales bacterium UBA8482]